MVPSYWGYIYKCKKWNVACTRCRICWKWILDGCKVANVHGILVTLSYVMVDERCKRYMICVALKCFKKKIYIAICLFIVITPNSVAEIDASKLQFGNAKEEMLFCCFVSCIKYIYIYQIKIQNKCDNICNESKLNMI